MGGQGNTYCCELLMLLTTLSVLRFPVFKKFAIGRRSTEGGEVGGRGGRAVQTDLELIHDCKICLKESITTRT